MRAAHCLNSKPGVVRLVVLLLLLTSAQVRAEGPWVVTLGAGPAEHRVGGRRSDFMLGASSRIDAGYRVVDTAAFGAGLGVHLGVGYMRSDDIDSQGCGATCEPFDFGFSAQLLIADRVLVVPWAGYLDIGLYRNRAAGVELGYDFRVCDRNRLTAVATYTRSPGLSASHTYDGIGVRIAYRYW
jgi:hypothetical protein